MTVETFVALVVVWCLALIIFMWQADIILEHVHDVVVWLFGSLIISTTLVFAVWISSKIIEIGNSNDVVHNNVYCLIVNDEPDFTHCIAKDIIENSR